MESQASAICNGVVVPLVEMEQCRRAGARGGNRAFGCGHAEAGTPTDIQAEMSGWRFEPMERARWELSMNTQMVFKL